jgi:uncharacterized damage-inducible protein DinB
MTYYGGKELAASFRTVRNNTIRIAEDIPEDRYDFRPVPASRTIRDTLVHIALSTTFPSHVHTNRITDIRTVNFQEITQQVNAEQAAPRTKAEIVALLRSTGDTFASFLDGLSESFLAETVTMMPGAQPPVRTRFDMLLSAKEHEMHHRGQLMLLERMLGIVPHLTREFQERMARMQAAPAQR